VDGTDVVVDAGGQQGAGGGGGVRVQDVQQVVPVAPGAGRAPDKPHAAAGEAAERPRRRSGREGQGTHPRVRRVRGVEFSMGQALGGHMRRHRGETGTTTVVLTAADVDDSGGATVPQPPEAMLDLN
ncbi:Os09g0483800, partial [Oryza sativa Japonica Group]